jgi:hypothetical protein
MNYEIVERSSGFWVVDRSTPNGPFDTVEEAQDWIEQQRRDEKNGLYGEHVDIAN